ncbi:hypothetical protein [Planosporangium mesophilum]|uniref:Uncharacterized protein n=1 Tax=Planosporangium mesophilum TaxID=689768 RepID=A0A8J3THI3_9ACTN|nr:hypothetical protein [Planosporangium mesophilum]NJC85727.1 hypothetical protein [Planosporangium mesophilum]GII24809.1 hypothetical protein Pme01_44060 [Planosporangium mesophilum]
MAKLGRRLFPHCSGYLLSALVLLVAVLVGGAPTTLPPTTTDSATAPPGTRAMWVWTAADPAAVVTWATTHRVTTVFAYVDPQVATNGDLPRLQELKRRCDEAGIVLDALGGEPDWALDHARALAWQLAVRDTGLFHALHLDVEPYALPEWNTARDATVRGFLTLLDEFIRPADQAVEVDVAFWYATVPVGDSNLADEVLRRADALTIMSYRDTATGPNSILDVGADLLGRAGRAAKPARLAVETQPLADCGYCTFAPLGAQRMERVLADVDRDAQRYNAFAGIAVHGYGSWTALQP